MFAVSGGTDRIVKGKDMEKILKEVKVEHNNQTYSVIAYKASMGYIVKAFRNNFQVGPQYTVSFGTYEEFKTYEYGAAVEVLLRTAANDIMAKAS